MKTKTDYKPLSWKAKRNGEIYCAPACGMGCTHEMYLEAHAKADALIAKCKAEVGGSWTKHIHENLGWHYRVMLKGGNITIHEYRDGSYGVSSHGGGTPSHMSIRGGSTSIKRLVKEQLDIVKKEADIWNEYLEKNTKGLKLEA